MINIALPKGRLGNKVYDLFEKIGYESSEIKEDNRKLIFENREKNVRFLLVKPSDVGVYVEKGSADIGVVGRDVLLEENPDIYELMDLGFGKCKFAIEKVGTFDTELVEEFFIGFTWHLNATLHIKNMAGKNSHYIIESIFKGVARALSEAVSIDEKYKDEIPSTKGVLV